MAISDEVEFNRVLLELRKTAEADPNSDIVFTKMLDMLEFLHEQISELQLQGDEE